MGERLIPAGEYADVRNLYTNVMSTLKECGYGLDIRGDAWLREGGISAKEYAETSEGKDLKRFHMIRMTRAGQTVIVDLDLDALAFKLRRPDRTEEVRASVDRRILVEMRQVLDDYIDRRLNLVMGRL